VAKLQTFRLPRFETEWRVEKSFLITVAGPCRTYTSFPFVPLQAPRILLSQVVQPRAMDVNGIKTFLTQNRFPVNAGKLSNEGHG
jgi:hypothetical protein